MQWKTENRIIKVGFAAAIFIMLTISSFSHFFFLKNMRDAKELQHSYKILEKKNALLSNISDAETGYRGFIITGNNDFLEPYYISIERNDTIFQSFKELVKDDDELQKISVEISGIIQKKYAFSQKVIDLKRNKSFDTVSRVINAGEGKQLMDALREQSRLVESYVERKLQQMQTEAEDNERFANILIPVGMAINAGILFLLYYILYRQLQRIKKNEEQLVEQTTEKEKMAAELEALTKNLEQKVVEKTEELLKKEAHFEQALDTISEGIQIIGFDWKYLYVNDTALSQNKLSREQLIGSTIFEKFPGIKNTPFFHTLEKCMHRRLCDHFEYEFSLPDNSKRWYKFSVEPIPDGIFILSIDINDRKIAEKQNEEYVHGLEEMIFMTSHKVRPPITRIIGITNMLEDDEIHSQEELKKIAAYLYEAIQSLDVLTKELSKYAHGLKDRTGLKKTG